MSLHLLSAKRIAGRTVESRQLGRELEALRLILRSDRKQRCLNSGGCLDPPQARDGCGGRLQSDEHVTTASVQVPNQDWPLSRSLSCRWARADWTRNKRRATWGWRRLCNILGWVGRSSFHLRGRLPGSPSNRFGLLDMREMRTACVDSDRTFEVKMGCLC
jgi:hypothetical protein